MQKKAISGIMVMLLSISMLTLAFNIQLVKASETIYIRADGSVEGTDKIQRDGDVYTFADNIYDEIVIQRSNIVIDGNHHILQGSRSGIGLNLTDIDYVLVKRTNIQEFEFGILIERSSHNIVLENNISNNVFSGVAMSKSSYNTVSGNNISNNIRFAGVWLEFSLSNKIYHNNFINNPTQAQSLRSYDNIWDDSYPSGGNYWSDYGGIDLHDGPNQDQPDSDGIGDTFYVVNANDTDRYPLWNPYGSSPPTHVLAITATTGGTTNPPPEVYSYNEGTVKVITAAPYADYNLHHWELDGVNVGSTNPISSVIDRNHLLHAVFVYHPPPPPPPGPNTLYVSPAFQEAMVGETFTVDIMLSDVNNLYGYEFRLFYDTNVLTALDSAPHIGTTMEPGFFFPQYFVWANRMEDDPYGNGTGYIWLAVGRPLGTKEGLSGSGKLATITFTADSEGTSTLTFSRHILTAPYSPPITHTVIEGSVTVLPPPAIPATIDIDPDTLNLGSKATWVSAYIEPYLGLGANQIDATSILLNRTIPIDVTAPTLVVDYDGDGISDLMVKFDRATVTSYISQFVEVIDKSTYVTLTVSGTFIDGSPFRGSCTIKVTTPKGGVRALLK